MPSPLALSIVIVSYNTRDITLACLASISAYPPSVPFEVIVLDNASQDGSFAAIVAAYPGIIAMSQPDNMGFAAGNNIAAQRARGRRLLLLNPDTLVRPGTFDALWEFAEHEPERGIWGGRTLFPDGSLNPKSCWRRITLWSLACGALGLTWALPGNALFNPESYGAWQRDHIREVDIVSGCFLLIDAWLWRTLGGFDPVFFMYAEEADLCLRAHHLGARPAITPDAELVHLGGASEPSGTEKVIKLMRGRVTLMRKHWGRTSFAAGRLILILWAGSRMIGSRWLSGPRDLPGDARTKWTTIWSRRAEWLAGYSR